MCSSTSPPKHTPLSPSSQYSEPAIAPFTVEEIQAKIKRGRGTSLCEIEAAFASRPSPATAPVFDQMINQILRWDKNTKLRRRREDPDETDGETIAYQANRLALNFKAALAEDFKRVEELSVELVRNAIEMRARGERIEAVEELNSICEWTAGEVRRLRLAVDAEAEKNPETEMAVKEAFEKQFKRLGDAHGRLAAEWMEAAGWGRER